MFFKEGPRIVCIRESRLQQLVVWMMDGFLWHGLSKKVACGGLERRMNLPDSGPSAKGNKSGTRI
jgi:hypothetical protein